MNTEDEAQHLHQTNKWITNPVKLEEEKGCGSGLAVSNVSKWASRSFLPALKKIRFLFIRFGTKLHNLQAACRCTRLIKQVVVAWASFHCRTDCAFPTAGLGSAHAPSRTQQVFLLSPFFSGNIPVFIFKWKYPLKYNNSGCPPPLPMA